MKKIALLILLIAAAVNFSACGKMSDPEPLEGSNYPHTYPRR